MKFSQKNVLDLENPDEYHCIAIHYRRGHSELLVRVFPNNPDEAEFFLIFQAVEYFEGPLMWSGADFCIATDDESQNFLTERGLDISLSESFKLFVVDYPGIEFKVKIIAAKNVPKSDTPGDFYWLAKSDTDG
jgi:hypothetical protein